MCSRICVYVSVSLSCINCTYSSRPPSWDFFSSLQLPVGESRLSSSAEAAALPAPGRHAASLASQHSGRSVTHWHVHVHVNTVYMFTYMHYTCTCTCRSKPNVYSNYLRVHSCIALATYIYMYYILWLQH